MRRALLALLVACVVATAVLGSVLPASGAPGAAGHTPTVRQPAAPRKPPASTPTVSASTPRERAVVRTLTAVERAFRDGDTRLMCRPGRLVDPAVIRRQHGPSGCESQYESLLADSQMRLTVRAVQMRPDLATATVSTASGAIVRVDLIRHGSRWLLSFSDGDDPLPALTS